MASKGGGGDATMASVWGWAAMRQNINEQYCVNVFVLLPFLACLANLHIHLHMFARLVNVVLLVVVISKVFHMCFVHCWFQMSCASGVLHKAALTYICKAKSLRGRFVKYNQMTERWEYLHMTQTVTDAISKRWALMSEVFIL
jgi:hypothetical protein